MKPQRILAALALAAGLAGAAIPTMAATAPAPQKQANACFFTRSWSGSKAIDEHTLYLRTGVKEVFRVDFANGCSRMDSPWAQFVQISRGSTVCSPLDLDLYVSTTPGVKTACIATALRKLTPAEVSALPKNARP